MTNQEQTDINRLIATGTPENLSLAYHLMVGQGVDSVKAMSRILRYRCYDAGETATFFGRVTFRIWNCYNTIECVLYVHEYGIKRSGHYLFMHSFLSEFGDIWQDKI